VGNWNILQLAWGKSSARDHVAGESVNQNAKNMYAHDNLRKTGKRKAGTYLYSAPHHIYNSFTSHRALDNTSMGRASGAGCKPLTFTVP
jgi:hypothetical protein